MNPKTLVLIATGCGFVAMLGILQAKPGAQTQESPKIRVLVATTDIPTGVELTGDNVQFVEMPTESVPEDAVTSREQYEQHAPKFAVMTGDTIRQSRLAMKDEATH